MFWTYETGRGRVFGCVPGHYVWTFDDPWFRLLLLRGIAWAGGGSVYRFDPLVLRGARVAED
jgi:type 1 glutamine amidotransferase